MTSSVPRTQPRSYVDLSRDFVSTPPLLGPEARAALAAVSPRGVDPYGELNAWFGRTFGSIDKLTPAQAAKLAGELQAMDHGFALVSLAGSLNAYANAYTALVRLVAVRDFEPGRTEKNIFDWARGAFGESNPIEVRSQEFMTSASADKMRAIVRTVMSDPRLEVDVGTRTTFATLERRATIMQHAQAVLAAHDAPADDAAVNGFYDACFGGLGKLTREDAQGLLKIFSELGRDTPRQGAAFVVGEVAYMAWNLLDLSLERRPSTLSGWSSFFARPFEGGDRLVKAVGLERAVEYTIAVMDGHDPTQAPRIRAAARELGGLS